MREKSEILEQVKSIFREAEYKALAMIYALPLGLCDHQTQNQPEWMTASQLAEYWQLFNDENKPTTSGIMKWVNRLPDEHPLPCARMGDLYRFNRKQVDAWAQEEAELKRAQKTSVNKKQDTKLRAIS